MPPAIVIAFTAANALPIFILMSISNHDQRQGNPGQKSCALLANRNTRYLEGVRGLLETAFDTIFTVADAGSLVEGTDRLQPTVIVVDLAVANGDFADLIRRLRKSSPASKVIALSVHNDPAVVDALLAAGADGVVLKHMIAGDLMVAIDKTLEGDSFGMPDAGPIQR